MPHDRSESKYEIEFDDQGRLRVRDPALARRLIRLAGAKDGLDIVIVTPPDRGRTAEESTPVLPPDSSCPKDITIVATPPSLPPPNAPPGCTNICPFRTSLSFDPRALKQWAPEAEKLLGRPNEGP